jgi:hypothetical protein
MVDENFLAERFQENRLRLRAVAYRMLGSLSESDDALQEAWLRASAADTDEVRNFQAWLTTIVGRVCLNLLRSRQQRREDSLETHIPDPVALRLRVARHVRGAVRGHRRGPGEDPGGRPPARQARPPPRRGTRPGPLWTARSHRSRCSWTPSGSKTSQGGLPPLELGEQLVLPYTGGHERALGLGR